MIREDTGYDADMSTLVPFEPEKKEKRKPPRELREVGSITLSSEPKHGKTNKVAVCPLTTQITCIRPVIRLYCPHEEAFGPWLSLKCTAKTVQTGMSRLI